MKNHLKEKEYIVEVSRVKSKRICLALDLKNDPELIREYKRYHQPEGTWKIITDGIRKSGIDVMDIYNIDNRLFMICEVPQELDLDECWTKMGTYPRQDEWGELMAQFQQALPGHKPEWVKMERVFTMPSK